jgi:acyl-CoA thioesterase FadM
MNNGIYLTLMDVARFDMLKRSGAWKACKKASIHPVVVGETISFRKSLKLGQKFSIETGVLGWNEVAFFIRQRFVVEGEIYAEAVVRLRFLKSPKGTPSPLEVLDLMGGWSGDALQLPEWVSAWEQAIALPKVRESAPSQWPGREVL